MHQHVYLAIRTAPMKPIILLQIFLMCFTMLHAQDSGRLKQVREELSKGEYADALKRLLLERGYEPQQDAAGGTWLRNCVFDELADQQHQLVCGMNLSLLKGMLKALPEAGMEARLQPAAGRCCVVLLPAGSEAEGLEEA